MIFDSSREIEVEEMNYASRLVQEQEGRGAAYFPVINKIDLSEPAKELTAAVSELANQTPAAMVSAKTGKGVDELEQMLVDMALRGKEFSSDGGTTITNSRHYAALVEAKKSLELSLESLDQKQSSEFVVTDLRSALDALGRITGAVTTDEILDVIFAQFCIGK
jgi:tRNA modification GTPase